jgi:tetratricopeptide (TPR) repeat protein
MLRRNLKTICRQNLRIVLGLVVLCGGAAGQAARKAVSAEDFYRRGLAAVRAEKCAEAVADFDRAIDLDPDDARFYKERGECLNGRADKLADFEKALALKPAYAAAYLGRGQVYFDQSRVDEMSADDGRNALADFNTAAGLDPKNSAIYYSRGKLYFHYFKDREKAFRDFAKAVELAPQNHLYLMGRAVHYQLDREFEKAIADYTAVLKLKPRDFDAYLMRGWSYFKTGANEKAIVDYTTALKIKPEYADQAYEKRAAAYRAAGKLREADADARRAFELVKKEDLKAAEIHCRRGLAGMKKAEKILPEDTYLVIVADSLTDSLNFEFKEAIDHFSDAIELNPKDARFFRERGFCRWKIDERAGALEDFNRALEIKPDFVDAYILRAAVLASYRQDKEFLAKGGFYEKAAADFQKAVDLNPKRAETYISRARYLHFDLLRRDLKNGLADLAKALELNPRSAAALILRARFNFRKDTFEEAIADTTAAIKLEPRNAFAYKLRGDAYAELKNYEQAIASYTAAIRIEPNYLFARRERSFAYKQIGKFDEAAADEEIVARLERQ